MAFLYLFSSLITAQNRLLGSAGSRWNSSSGGGGSGQGCFSVWPLGAADRIKPSFCLALLKSAPRASAPPPLCRGARGQSEIEAATLTLAF